MLGNLHVRFGVGAGVKLPGLHHISGNTADAGPADSHAHSKENRLNARQKLNLIHVSGALLLAAILGGLLQSWAIFLITSAILIADAVYGGDIRPGGRRRQ